MNFDSLKDQVSNLTLYDIKAGVRKVQNAVMNYTEMEAKVREATNNEPWGASSSLMQEISNGTHSYQLLNEIMPMIYKRFTDKTAEEWRQIYKALQLLEFLIKNGSERVIDDARSHLSLLRMLRQFHFIDPNGKDQGVNVRNRAQELAKLLNDVDQIRAERKKARANRNKYGGVEGGAGAGGFSGGNGSRYGGFGSEDQTFGGFSGGVYGDGGGFSGSSGQPSEIGRRSERFEEYDEYDEAGTSTSSRRRAGSGSAAAHAVNARPAKKPEVTKPKQPEQDLLFDEEPVPSVQSVGKSGQRNQKSGLPGPNAEEDDDFDDFQSATPAPDPEMSSMMTGIQIPATFATSSRNTRFEAPQPVSATQGPSVEGLVGSSATTFAHSGSRATLPMSLTGPNSFVSMPSPATQSQESPQPLLSGYQAKQPNYFTSVQAPSLTTMSVSQPDAAKSAGRPNMSTVPSNTLQGTKPAASKVSGDAFGSLWSSASAGAGIQKTSLNKGPNLASMAQAKSSAGIWGAPAPSATSTTSSTTAAPRSRQAQDVGSSLDDLLR